MGNAAIPAPAWLHGRAVALFFGAGVGYLVTVPVLAAAYAAAGRFEEATQIANLAVELARAANRPDFAEFVWRCDLYQSGRLSLLRGNSASWQPDLSGPLSQSPTEDAASPGRVESSASHSPAARSRRAVSWSALSCCARHHPPSRCGRDCTVRKPGHRGWA